MPSVHINRGRSGCVALCWLAICVKFSATGIHGSFGRISPSATDLPRSPSRARSLNVTSNILKSRRRGPARLMAALAGAVSVRHIRR